MARKQNHISSTSQMRRFVLIRVEDLTGVSGTGEVAEGTVFSSGLAVIHWLREPYAMGVYQTLEDVIFVHGHEGRTQLQFID
jgi:L-alanine-DL-glutamate epimerase-like enolase superfamily enzyme